MFVQKHPKKEREVEKKLPQHLHCKLQNEIKQQDLNQQQQQPQQTQQDLQPQHRIPPKRDTLQDETSPMQNEEYSSTVRFPPNDRTCNIFAVNSEPTSVEGGPSITDSFLEAIKVCPSDSKHSEKYKVNSIKVSKNEIRENEHIEQSVRDYGSFAEEIKVEHKDFTCSSEVIPLAACVNDSGGRPNSVTFNPEMTKRAKINDKCRQSKEKYDVILNNLPASFERQDLECLFREKYEGFKRAFLAKQKGAAIATFVSPGKPLECATKMKELRIWGKKVSVREKILDENDSQASQCSGVQLDEVETGEKVKNWLTQSGNLLCDDLTTLPSLSTTQNNRTYSLWNSIEDQGYTACELAHGQSVTSDVSMTQKKRLHCFCE